MIKNFECVGCGKCCRLLNINGKATEKDFERWHKNKRDDILKWVVKDQFWIDPETKEFVKECPWLNENLCGIHEDKPDWCRDYPKTIQNAKLHKCSGLLKK